LPFLLRPSAPSPSRLPLFTQDQVAQGRPNYSQYCATCHGAQLQNGGAPPLIGESFKDRWNSRPVGGFYDYVHQTMPLGDAASLAPGVYVDIVAFILAQNGFPTGAKPLSKAEREAPLDFPAASSGKAAVPPPAAKIVIGALDGPVTQPTTHAPSQAELDAADTQTMSFGANALNSRGIAGAGNPGRFMRTTWWS
jgi:hypothetical protein